jgi:hypothetical protein
MKLIIIFLIAFTLLNAQTEVQISNLEISRHQVIGIENINNKLYIVSFGGQGNSILDVYDMDKHTIENDILKDAEGKITFGNSNMFKDKLNNLWIGDINSLIKIEEKRVSDGYKITNIYKDVELPDSSLFEIKSITEDGEGNLYFLKRNSDILVSEVVNGKTYRWFEANLEIVKYDGEKLKTLHTIDNIGPFVEDIYFYKNKLYCSFLILGNKFPKLYTFDLKTKEFETTNFTLPTIEDIPDLEWEKVKMAIIEKSFEINNELYFFVNIDANMSRFHCFAKYDEVNSKFIYYYLPRNIEHDKMIGITSFVEFKDKLICSGYSYNGETRPFFEFKRDKFEPFIFENEINPQIITNSAVHQELKQRNFKFEHGEFMFRDEIHIDNQGNLYAGTDKGLIFIENFYQKTSSVEKQELELKTIPELTNVKNELYIESEFVINSYKVYDINSKMIQTESNLNSNNINLNLEGLTIGIYFIEIETQKGSKLLKFINKN